jgi:cephalosporin hydroxylase
MFDLSIENDYQLESEFLDLLDEVTQRNPRVILEIGSLHGYTLQGWGSAVQRGAFIISVDLLLPPGDSRHFLQKAGHEGGWSWMLINQGHYPFIIPGDSRNPETVGRVANITMQPNRAVDFLFIDGDHTYEGVKADFENYFPFLRKGGMVAFHDIAANESGGGVHRFWNEIKGGFQYREILHSETHNYGIGVLYV